ncbi:MAG: hypothetical protein A3D65_05365 [Candidatus Lloydbacteria bacterium RIFCSPHIGHO2_02_FULL_50_13]|uniref:Uncharacterized protein n=1 Tax=Candidatus Lloydbacteria bacterium RIFCSPHIGHO2_02_FULL_50_13 TaxID=1798661 RepID=A0A1G2D813_9BACT|nr:MAG: hypothetical protein A3D65_05365 [Candidatus Lloydbacteria bacterium RIFCSPHIGHO2_02_FULL_50_13]
MFPSNNIHTSVILRFFSTCLIVLLLVTMVFMMTPQKAEAIGIPFGGMSLSVFWCICSFNLWIIVGPPVGGSFIYQPGLSILYLFGQIYRPGVWLLGLAAPAAVPCLVPFSGGCFPIGFGLPIEIVGTSM